MLQERDGKKVWFLQVTLDVESGALNVGGVAPGEAMLAAWLLLRASHGMAEQVGPKDIAAALAPPSPIQVVSGMDDVGVKGARRVR